MNNLINYGSVMINPTTQISEDLLDDFLLFVDRGEATERTYINNLKQFFAYLKYAGIENPNRLDIIDYRDWLATEHEAICLDSEAESGWAYRTDRNGKRIVVTCKPKTIKIYLQSVKQFFKWSAMVGLYPDIAQNLHGPKVSKSRSKDSLTTDEIEAIEDSIKEKQERASYKQGNATRKEWENEKSARMYAMFLLASNVGLRTIEIVRANIGDLRTREGKTYLYILGKGETEKEPKPVAREVKKAIDNYLLLRADSKGPDAPLFASIGNRNGGQRMDRATVSKLIKQAMREAGIDDERLTAHSLRHTTASQVLEVTENNIYQTQLYMGHSDPRTTEIYLDNNRLEENSIIAEKVFNKMHRKKAREESTANLIEKLLERRESLTEEERKALALLGA